MGFENSIKTQLKKKSSLEASFRPICKYWKIRDTMETLENQIGVIGGSIVRNLKCEG